MTALITSLLFPAYFLFWLLLALCLFAGQSQRVAFFRFPLLDKCLEKALVARNVDDGERAAVAGGERCILGKLKREALVGVRRRTLAGKVQSGAIARTLAFGFMNNSR